jgi:hypothetical protein
MAASTPDLILRAYHGRESGIMIIGTAQTLERLGTQLLSAANTPASGALPEWPPEVSSPAVSGPYVDVPNFKLSFHVLRAQQLPISLPLRRRGLPLALVLAVGALALIGAAAIVGWLL